jgi:single-strand selective monofunctional uracil DNA glycosylase
MELLKIADELVRDLRRLKFGRHAAYVYNPLEYARPLYEAYVRSYGAGRREIVLVGMNPGPWGMAQTGVPFGEVSMVRDWLGINRKVGRPAREHPKRPVLGLDCLRSEVSGQRLWGWARATFGEPQAFFERFFVANYCPLCFMEASGRNLTPDKLPREEREALQAICDRAFHRTVEHFDPKWVIGLGNFATARARIALSGMDVRIETMLHPSPASPKANRDWPGQATKRLRELGIMLPK